MIKMKTTVIIIFSLLTVELNGQTHSLHAGGAYYEFNELKGNTFGAGYDFLKSTPKNTTSISLGWQRGFLDMKDDEILFNNISLTVARGYKWLGEKRSRFLGYAGFSVDLNPSLIRRMGDESNRYSWNTTNTFNLYQLYTYHWKNSSLLLNIHLPLIGLASSPDSNTVYAQNKTAAVYNSYSNLFFTSPDNFKAIQLSIGYKKDLSKRFQLSLEYQYSYSDLKEKVPVSMKTSGLQLGLSYHLLP